MPPRTFFFAGKAAPAYRLAKLIIKLINDVAGTIDADPVVARPAAGAVPARVQRQPGRAADPGERRLRADLDRGLRGQRHEQHEVHDERRADRRHPRRRDDRDGRGGGRGELLPLRPDRRAGRGQPRLVRPALALRARPRDARGARPDLLGALQPRRARRLRADPRRPADAAATTTCTWPTSRRTPTAQAQVGDRLPRTARPGRARPSSTSRPPGRFSSDRTIAEYAAGIWKTKPCPVDPA